MGCRVLAGCAALALALGCGGNSMEGTGSIGVADAGPTDGGAPDAGAADAGGPYGNLTSISLSQTDVHIPVGTMTAFAVTGTYSDGTRADLTQQAQATSSNTSVATVAHGQGSQIQITAVGVGTATVTVTVGSLSQNCAVTVTR
ncbi:MAG TPA: Ig-like domain-containing protein [Myxococcales bacterium]|nr:Ig-like domain-containing protein [Myxococcales bacterium]